MIENNFRYTITVTYVDNVNEAFNPSFLGSFLIDRQYLSNSIFWYDEIRNFLKKEYNKTHCLPVMIKCYDVDNDNTTEYIVFQNMHNKLQFSSLKNPYDVF